MESEALGAQFFQTNCGTNAAGAVTKAVTKTCGGLLANGLKEDVDRTRSGYETALAYKSIEFQSEYISESFEGSGYSRDIDSWYATAMWNVTGEKFADMYKEGVFGRLKPKQNYKSGGEGWGA